MVAAIKAQGGHSAQTYTNSFPSGFYAEAFVDPGRLTQLPSWSRSRDPEWQAYPNEQFHDIGGHV